MGFSYVQFCAVYESVGRYAKYSQQIGMKLSKNFVAVLWSEQIHGWPHSGCPDSVPSGTTGEDRQRTTEVYDVHCNFINMGSRRQKATVKCIILG